MSAGDNEGKQSVQTANLYTPAVAGYVNEGYVMKYFDEMVAAFRAIEERGYCDLDKNAGHREELHKTVLDMLHCPMRTNEKVLTLLYEEVLQGSHKAQATAVLGELPPIIRSLGELGELWTHKFAENSTKALMKFKLPYDQSRKIFAVHQLPGLREAVYVAIPPSDQLKRDDWMIFLHEYVYMNALLHRTDEYTTADVDRLEQHMDAMFELLVAKIGGAERGVTNYFHYIGSGHLMWMIRRYGNLWRFCNEGAESMNSLVSKRYNQFNNKGGNKQASVGSAKLKCLPFEVIGKWLGRLSAWHAGLAVDMFQMAWDCVSWTVDSKTTWSQAFQCYVYEDDDSIDVCHDSDSDLEASKDLEWLARGETGESESDDEGAYADNFTEDFGWMKTSDMIATWEANERGALTSKRLRFQNRPVQLLDLTLLNT
jgi:hypothetical protein